MGRREEKEEDQLGFGVLIEYLTLKYDEIKEHFPCKHQILIFEQILIQKLQGTKNNRTNFHNKNVYKKIVIYK